MIDEDLRPAVFARFTRLRAKHGGRIHHSAFDTNILGIDPDATVHIRTDILAEVDGPMLKYGLQATHGTRLVLPRAAEQRPNREFLAERFAEFKAA